MSTNCENCKRLEKRVAELEQRCQELELQVGDNKLMFILKNKLKVYSSEFRVYIVQPGVDSTQITTSMHQVLCSAEAYLKDTYAIPLTLICS